MSVFECILARKNHVHVPIGVCSSLYASVCVRERNGFAYVALCVHVYVCPSACTCVYSRACVRACAFMQNILHRPDGCRVA